MNQMTVTTPERVTTYLKNPTGNRLPFSCTLAVLKAGTSLADILNFTIRSLKSGAGVKLIIEEDFRFEQPTGNQLYIDIDPSHPDSKFFEELKKPVTPDPVPGAVHYSCEDSIESIIKGLQHVIQHLPNSDVKVELTNLRHRDKVNDKGLVASGPVIFEHLFRAVEYHMQHQNMHSLLRLFGYTNMVILRGGYKKGIITSAILDSSPYVYDYLEVPLVSIPGSHKKGLILTDEPDPTFASHICELVNSENLFLQKLHQDRLYANVCQGILLRDRGTCLIYRVNLGKIDTLADLPAAFVLATEEAISTHYEWRQLHPDKANLWASLEDDNQVAVDVMGMANLLCHFGISYKEFIAALHGEATSDDADYLCLMLRKAYRMSTEAADLMTRKLGIPTMQRLHTVEPAQSHSYRETDLQGNTIARGVWTPFSRFVNRMSHADNEEIRTYDFGDVETRLTPDEHFRLCNGYFKLMTASGRPHAFSYDTLKDFGLTEFMEWFDSDLPTLYYNMSRDYNTDYARKKIEAVQLCSSCED